MPTTSSENVADSLSVVGEATTGSRPSTLRHGIRRPGQGEPGAQQAISRRIRRGRARGRVVLISRALAGVITASVVAVGVSTGFPGASAQEPLVAFLFLVTLLVEPVQMLVETINQAQSRGGRSPQGAQRPRHAD